MFPAPVSCFVPDFGVRVILCFVAHSAALRNVKTHVGQNAPFVCVHLSDIDRFNVLDVDAHGTPGVIIASCHLQEHIAVHREPARRRLLLTSPVRPLPHLLNSRDDSIIVCDDRQSIRQLSRPNFGRIEFDQAEGGIAQRAHILRPSAKPGQHRVNNLVHPVILVVGFQHTVMIRPCRPLLLPFQGEAYPRPPSRPAIECSD